MESVGYMRLRLLLCVVFLTACATPAPPPSTLVAPAPTSIASTPTNAEPAPTSMAPASTSVAPTPTSVAPTPASVQTNAVPAMFYVATNGNDTWSGTLSTPNANKTDGPFATIERAKIAVRERRRVSNLPHGDLSVEIQGGIYQLAAPLILTNEDGGSANAHVIYRAAAGQSVRLIGGRLLDLSTLAAVTDPAVAKRINPAALPSVRQINLRSLGIDDYGQLSERNSGYYAVGALELFYNTRPLQLARWPNIGEWALIDGQQGKLQQGSFRYPGDRPKGWQPSDDIWAHGYFSTDYSDRYERVTAIDQNAHTISTTAAQFNYAEYLGGQRFAFLNVLEELDQPGEWYLDRATGILYIWPPDDPARSEAYVSMLADPLIQLQNASYVTIQGLTIEGGRGVAVAIEGGSKNLLAGLTLRNMGTDGARISGQQNSILSSDIYDVGDSGIRLTGGDQQTLLASENTAQNNHIYRYARFVRTSRAAIDIQGVGMRVAHNLIHDAPAVAIQYSGNDHLIELNDIGRVALETSDVGAIHINGSWAGRGNIIRNNYFHDLDLAPPLPDKNGAQAIYLDNYASGTNIIGNVFYRPGARAVFINSGPLNRVENNIFIGGAPYGVYIQYRDWTDLPQDFLNELDALNYRQPPYATRYPEIVRIRDVPPEQLRWPRGNIVERNLFYQVPTPIDTPRGVPASIFTIDRNLITQNNPGFAALDRQNFMLTTNTPELRAIGFEPIPFDTIGLMIDTYRTKLP